MKSDIDLIDKLGTAVRYDAQQPTAHDGPDAASSSAEANTPTNTAVIAEPGEAAGRPSTQAETLIELAQTADLFRTPARTGYADIVVNGHRETWPIRSKEFRRWLLHGYFLATGGAPNSEALQSALGVIDARAQFNAPERVVHIRVGDYDGRLYLDLCDENWRAVEIDAKGWCIVANPPLRFRRTAGMLPLPAPVSGGSINELRAYVNIRSDADFVLAVAFLLACLRDKGPYPVLVLAGEQGSAKSTLAALLRSLIDPNTSPLRALPRDDRDLFIAALNAHMLAFDNVSGLSTWISDTFCRLATGGGFAVRQLYTDQDEILFSATRPIILNGIEDMVNRPDLGERSLFLVLEPIPDDQRRPEAKLWAAFEAVRPSILGALLDAVVMGLARLRDTKLEKLPRMADFALWATACETALWPAGTFAAAYDRNRSEAVLDVLDADPVAVALLTMMDKRAEWTGTATGLLKALADEVDERIAHSKNWPGTAKAMSGRLRRIAPSLRKIGIVATFSRTGHRRDRTIRLTRLAADEVLVAKE